MIVKQSPGSRSAVARAQAVARQSPGSRQAVARQSPVSQPHLTSTTSKSLSENLKKMLWDNLVSPIDAKNSIGFLVPFFLG